MSVMSIFLLGGGGILAGFINALAGGAGFLLFPLMIGSGGMSPMAADASLFIALLPANVVGVLAARRDIDMATAGIPRRLVIGGIGGVIGSYLLIHFGVDAFNRAVPWLLLTATLLFGLAPLMRHALMRGFGQHGAHQHPAVLAVVEFILCTYGGYFGLGMGIVLLANRNYAMDERIRAAHLILTTLDGARP